MFWTDIGEFGSGLGISNVDFKYQRCTEKAFPKANLDLPHFWDNVLRSSYRGVKEVRDNCGEVIKKQ